MSGAFGVWLVCGPVGLIGSFIFLSLFKLYPLLRKNNYVTTL